VHKRGGWFPERFRSGVAALPARVIKKHARWTPIGPVWRYTMRATDGLQTTINLGPVHRDDQAFSLQLSLGMSLPVPSQDEHLPDQIEAFVHQAGLQIQRRLFRALIEKADQELVLQNRRRQTGAGTPGPAARSPAPAGRGPRGGGPGEPAAQRRGWLPAAGGGGRSPSRRPSAR